MIPFVALLLTLVFGTASAEEATSLGPVQLDRSEQFLLSSKAVGDSFRIDVVLPIRYAESEQRYPVVYVTDSNYLLTSAAATQLAQALGDLPPMILVGIGYDVESISGISQLRVRDFSPSCDQSYIKRRSHPKDLCGGADAFLAFIRDELQPFINSKYRATEDATLVGYSFGGLFALHGLFNRPDIFDRYVIGSPSIEWDEEILFAKEARYAKRNKDLKGVVHLSAGALEGNRTIPNTYLMYERMLSREYPGLTVSIDIFEEETHMTAINVAVMRGLRAVFKDGLD